MTQQQQFLKEQAPTLLTSLQADAPGLWGVMTAQHMLEHVSGLLYISLGKKSYPLMVPEAQLEKSRQWLMSDKEFRPGLAAPGIPANPGPLRFKTFEEAKEKCLQTLNLFWQAYEQNPALEAMHPVFGMLNQEQWEQFHYKHIHHHWMQFGLIPLSEYKKQKLAN